MLVDLGVHPSRVGSEEQNTYVARDVDMDVRTALADPRRRVVEVVAPRLAGATRTLAHWAREVLGDHVVVAFDDDPGVTLEEMVAAVGPYAFRVPDRGVVLWVESAGPRRSGELAALDVRALPTWLRVLATTREEAYALTLPTDGPRRLLQAPHTRIELGALENSEREGLEGDPEYASILRMAQRSATKTFLGRELVSWDGIRADLDPLTQATDRLAVVRAVTDWRRIGEPGHLTWGVLVELHRRYHEELSGRPGEVTLDGLRAALDWAGTATDRRPPLVTEHTYAEQPFYTPHRLLTAIADEAVPDVPVFNLSAVRHILEARGLGSSQVSDFDKLHERPGPGWAVGRSMWEYAEETLTGTSRRVAGEAALETNAFAAAHRLLITPDTDPGPEVLALVGIGLVLSAGDTKAGGECLLRVAESGDRELVSWVQALLDLFARYEGGAGPSEGSTAPGDAVHGTVAGIPDMLFTEDPVARFGSAQAARDAMTPLVGSSDPSIAALAMYRLGDLEVGQGDLRAARSWYQRMVGTRSTHAPAAALRLGRLAQDRKDNDEAKRWFRTVVDSGHTILVPSARFHLGQLALRAGDTDTARREWLEVADSGHPTAAPLAMAELAVVADNSGDLEQATKWYEQAVESGHTDAVAIGELGLGRFAFNSGDLEQAHTRLLRSVRAEHHQALPCAFYYLGALESGRGDTDAAREWYERAIETGHPVWSPEASWNLANLERTQGRMEFARAWFERTVESGHHELAHRAMSNLGMLARQESDPDGARRWYSRVLDSGDARAVSSALIHLAWLDQDQGDVDGARERYTRVIEIGHDRYQSQAMYDLGRIMGLVGDDEMARRWYQRAVETAHDSGELAPALAELAGLDEREDDLERARERLTRVVEIGDSEWSSYAMCRLGRLEEKRGGIDAARGWYTRAADSGYPKHAAHAMYLLGNLEWEQGDTEAARTWWDRLLELDGVNDTDILDMARRRLRGQRADETDGEDDDAES
jgi:TPR repeat protein